MRRDHLTFGMMIGLPIMQLLLFGYAINNDPRELPTLIEASDNGPITRSIVSGLESSGYFAFEGYVEGQERAEEALRTGEANFVLVIPDGFERDVVRGLQPNLLIAADASDPTALSGAVSAMSGIVDTALSEFRFGELQLGRGSENAFGITIHRHYNPEGTTSTNIVPGLLAIILSMTMVMITAIAIVKETERGTMETLISTPVKATEVMLGKILPYVLVGYVQTLVFILAASVLFDVPFTGSRLAFVLGVNLFILVNLALGFLISTAARNQMQAMQLSFFTILPSILLSGFMFPFAGMPGWAQALGQIVPATHFLRLVRAIMLKGADVGDVMSQYLTLSILLFVIGILAVKRYRQTLD